jgi:L-aminopeptidase/D-esterase-like protein
MVFSSTMPDFQGLGSIIIVVGTDAPLLPHQLKRLTRRAALGLSRTGSIASNGSGDIFIAFSTANDDVHQASSGSGIESVPNEEIVPLFEATVQATEEAIINALVAGRTMTGNRGNTVHGVDHAALQDVLRQYNRLVED